MPRPSMLFAAGSLALAVAASVAAPPAQAGTERAATPAVRSVSTEFALSGSGFGTRLGGGDVPVGSRTLAYQHIGCTDRAGTTRTNALASQSITGLGTLSGLTTTVWTTSHHGTVASHARHRIASLTLVDTAAGSVAITGIQADSTAYHDASGFHATATSSIAGITVTPLIGPAVALPLPTPGHPVSIAGLITISSGPLSARHSASGAVASSFGLRVDITPTDTHLKLGKTHATIAGGVTFGLFHGRSYASQVSALDDSLKSGPQPLTSMPCQGTGGRIRGAGLADLDLAGQVVVHGLATSQSASQTGRRAHGFEAARIAHVDLGSGALVIDGIVGRAVVTRTGDRLVRSSAGTSVGTLTVNGTTRRFPSTGTLTIPGVATLQEHVVRRVAGGLEVTALRISLLDGTGAVIDLGTAELRIAPRHR